MNPYELPKMPSTRYCLQCGKKKPYDPTKKPQTKASGFYGHCCWECRLNKLHAPIVPGASPKELAYKEHLKRLAALK